MSTVYQRREQRQYLRWTIYDACACPYGLQGPSDFLSGVEGKEPDCSLLRVLRKCSCLYQCHQTYFQWGMYYVQVNMLRKLKLPAFIIIFFFTC